MAADDASDAEALFCLELYVHRVERLPRRLREAPPVTAEGYAQLFPWHDTVADEAWYSNVRRILTTPREARAKRADGGSCARPTPDDALLRAWRDALADRPEDTSERPREKRRRTPPQTRPNRRRQDICPRATDDARERRQKRRRGAICDAAAAPGPASGGPTADVHVRLRRRRRVPAAVRWRD